MEELDRTGIPNLSQTPDPGPSEPDTNTEPEDTMTDEGATLPENDDISPILVMRIIRHLTSETPLSSQPKAYSQGSTAMFRYLCDVLEIEHHQVVGRRPKRALFDLLIQSVSEQHNTHST